VEKLVMSKPISAPSLIGLFVGICACGGSSKPNPAKSYEATVGGTAIDPLTGSPAVGVTVNAVNPVNLAASGGPPTTADLQSGKVASATTDNSGAFTFPEKLDMANFVQGVMLIFGDPDASNATWVNTYIGVNTVVAIKTAVDNNDTNFLNALADHTPGYAMKASELDTITGGPDTWFTNIAGLINNGFVFGMVLDSQTNPVPENGFTVEKSTTIVNNQPAWATITDIGYRKATAGLDFSGTSTVASVGAQFICADPMPINTVTASASLLAAFQGSNQGTATPLQTLITKGVAYMAPVFWE
jgi:hypothetical protein